MFDAIARFAAHRRGDRQRPYRRAALAFDTGRHELALDQLDAALAQAGDGRQRALTYNKRGVVLIALGRRREALEAFGSALAQDERCAAALTNVGSLLLEDGNVRDAVDYYESAIRCDDAYALAYRNLAVASKRLGKRASAVRLLRAAARLEARRRPEPA